MTQNHVQFSLKMPFSKWSVESVMPSDKLSAKNNRDDCCVTVRQLSDTIVRWDYLPSDLGCNLAVSSFAVLRTFVIKSPFTCPVMLLSLEVVRKFPLCRDLTVMCAVSFSCVSYTMFLNFTSWCILPVVFDVRVVV